MFWDFFFLDFARFIGKEKILLVKYIYIYIYRYYNLERRYIHLISNFTYGAIVSPVSIDSQRLRTEI